MKLRRLLTLSAIVSVASLFAFTDSVSPQSEPSAFELASPKDTMLVIYDSSIFPGDSVLRADTVVLPSMFANSIGDEDFTKAQTDTVVRTAIVFSDIYGKKDMEFARGFLLGMQQAELPVGSVSLKMINGSIPQDSLIFELNSFKPSVVFSTFEKDTPLALLSYTEDNYAKLFNVFDAKGDEYKYNPSVYELLSPSQVFNANAASYFMENFGNNVLLIVGEPDVSDVILKELIIAWPEEQMLVMSKEDLAKFSLDEGFNYILYPIVSGENEIEEIMKQIVKLIADNPMAGVRVVGRPNWITLNDLKKLVENVEVFVPAKCYFEPSADASKRFIAAYNGQYKHTPVKSYPVFAVMGYDAARYFMPLLVGEQRGDIGVWTPGDMLQSYFNMQEAGWGKGVYNDGGYILHFLPWGVMQKELLD